MKLNFNQIKEITTGAVLVSKEDGMISLKRFIIKLFLQQELNFYLRRIVKVYS